jgi:proline dehydrogenase
MKFHIFTCAIVATLCLSQPLVGQENDKKETPLGKQMEAMNDAYKAIKKETDPVKGATLARSAQDALIKSLSEVPQLVAKGPEADKAKSVANFRTMLGKAFVSFSEIEEAFVANDLEKVKTLVEDIRSLKKEGHEKYIEEDK